MTTYAKLLLAHINQERVMRNELIDDCPHYSMEDLLATDSWATEIIDEVSKMQDAVRNELEKRKNK